MRASVRQNFHAIPEADPDKVPVKMALLAQRGDQLVRQLLPDQHEPYI
jgi:hypothetical protein